MRSSMSEAGGDSKQEQGPERRRTILEMMIDGKEVDAALERAVREALLLHKKLGNPVAIWRDEKVVIVPPEEIPG